MKSYWIEVLLPTVFSLRSTLMGTTSQLKSVTGKYH